MPPTPLDPTVVKRFREAQTPSALADLFDPAPNTKKAEREATEQTLRALVGAEAYDRLVKRAKASRNVRRGGTRPNVVVLPGVMGSELSVGADGNQWKLWVSYWWIYRGYLKTLELDSTGTAPAGGAASEPVAATGLLNEYYADIVFQLGTTCEVRAFPYDWRLPLAKSAESLKGFIEQNFASGKATLVAHSMGGLVARSLMAQARAANGTDPVERLIMLGTPNYGSFEVPQIFAGIQNTVKELTRLTAGAGGLVSPNKRREARDELLRLLDTFPAIYQMLPVDDVPGLGPSEARRRLYNPDTYRSFNGSVSPQHLRSAVTFQRSIAGTIDPARMVYVAGYNQETATGVTDPDRLDAYESYEITLAGDGKVPHTLGLLAGVPTYFVDCAHADLPKHEPVLREIDNLVRGNRVNLPDTAPTRSRSFDDVRALSRSWAVRQAEADRAADADLRQQLDALPAGDRGADELTEPALSEPGIEIGRKLVKSIFGSTGDKREAAPAVPPPDAKFVLPALRVRLVYGNIATCHHPEEPDPLDSIDLESKLEKGPFQPTWKEQPKRPFTVPKDAVAIGKYLGVRPFNALSDLDARISRQLYPENRDTGKKADRKPRFYLQELIDRGLLRGDLGVPTLLPDPRPETARAAVKRDLVFAGMGTVGQYGEPEARLVARELVWFLGQSGKKHLATVLFGAGTGNVSPRDALRAFLDGAAAALRSEPRDELRLETITFVEYFGYRVREIDAALRGEFQRLAGSLQLDYTPYTEAELDAIEARDEKRDLAERKKNKGRSDQPESPIRVVAEASQDDFLFSAMTGTASVPQRRSQVDRRIILETNTSLMKANTPDEQTQAGAALGKMLIHTDLRRVLRSSVPIVMEVDADTARIHWEMVYRQSNTELDRGDFLGLERGFTRQLRTRFAVPPEPSAQRRRVLRALVVADPAADAPLPGARSEGREVVKLFEEFNRLAPPGFRIEVTALIGPEEAKRALVMQKLLTTEYHILHYAGHCFFEPERPSNCGWIFQLNRDTKRPELLAAPELLALDAIPHFVFSNACESGITPERRFEQAEGIAPAFAEAFFKQGVRDFVCTAWPVGDAAALVFARTFYARMLGLILDPATDAPSETETDVPAELVFAMRDARLAALRCGTGLTTWGAYQHYGNPYTRFFAFDGALPVRAPEAKAPGGPKGAARTADAQSRMADAEQTAARYAAQLRSLPGIADVRAGYRFVNGWITDEPAVVVSVLDKNALPSDDHRLPRNLDGIVVDIVPATPMEQIEALKPEDRRRLNLPPADELGETRKAPPLLKYPKDKATLQAFDEKMTVTCHLSPDTGWPVLQEFLTGPIEELTVAMYDFTAPHVRDRVLAALGDTGKLKLVLCPASGGAGKGTEDRGVKDNDFNEDDLKAELQAKLGKRLSFAWAAVPIEGKTTNGFFPRAYHIKVAVKDGKSFWLSSGNWQSSNQPSATDFPPDEARKTAWRKYNREWNLVIEHPGLAGVFKKVIDRDFTMAAKLQADARGRADTRGMPVLFVPLDPDDFRGADLPVVPAKPLVFTGRVKVQPILTPDNYVDFVLPLIQGAKTKLYFANQSLGVRTTRPGDTSVFGKLVQALKEKADPASKVDVRIILRDIGGVDQDLAGLQRLGFPMDKVKVQPALHTKGIVVDGKQVLVGSQNWTAQGVDTNRDASLLFDTPKIAEYFEASFLHDWERLAKQKVTSLTNPPRLLLDAVARSSGTAAGGIVSWHDYFGV